IALYRSLQEALSNATRHAGDTDVAVQVSGLGIFLYLSVSDRGPGFDVAAVPVVGHLGLAGMREQAELLGGRFTVESLAGQGTTVRICWPCAEVEETWET
ncbi:MAG TPA: ATP-binding protein, partial [Chloroflexota bacterium]|nr:ATP-binding protein [Chloroflexota bacterium]